jgi:small subunit ribosomal protein S19e
MRYNMPGVVDVDAEILIKRVAEKLEKAPEMKPPEWHTLVKTGVHKERPPTQKNWWWIRAASMLRKLYLNQPTGVTKLRKAYGGRKNKGHKPEHKERASGAIIRKLLQQLEAAGFAKAEKGKGRVLTPKGRLLLNTTAQEIKK